MVAILYNIRSIHNVGSIFRTADAAGIEKLYLCGVTPFPLDRFGKKRQDFVKVSLGSEDSVAWEKIDDTIKLIQDLRTKGYTIISLEQHATSIPYSAKLVFKQNIALVVGNEVDGLPQSILDTSDHIFEIPMRGSKESLNVSVSFGIAAFELTRNTDLIRHPKLSSGSLASGPIKKQGIKPRFFYSKSQVPVTSPHVWLRRHKV